MISQSYAALSSYVALALMASLAALCGGNTNPQSFVQLVVVEVVEAGRLGNSYNS
jgi:hypothetical protein